MVFKNEIKYEKIIEVSEFEQLDQSQFRLIKELNELNLNEINSRIEDLISSYEDYSQQVDFKKLSLQSKINELRQKLNSLMSFDNEINFIKL